MASELSTVPSPDFSDIPFTRSATGHVHSPWWTYDWRKYNSVSPYMIGPHFHNLRAQSVAAFAQALGVPEREVVVSVRESHDTNETFWRCGTAKPVALPQRKALKSPQPEPLTIDI